MSDGLRRRQAERRYRRAAVVAGLALVLATVAVFAKDNPLADGYEIRGVFSSTNQLKEGSEVRIAGIKVGRVSAIKPGPDHTSIATLEIGDSGRPLREDATLAIEPRLILEGNLYVDLRPGTPGAPELPDGGTIPQGRTSTPVQLDQVLDVFDLPTRGALHRTIAELADGLGEGDGGAGHEGLQRAFRELDGALGSVSRVARAARGTEDGDLGRMLRSSADFAGQLGADPAALAQMVTSFDRFTGALAAEDRALAATVRGFDEVLRAAPASLDALDGALPQLTRFAEALRPTLRAAPTTLRKANRLLGQTAAVVQQPELPALLDELRPVTATLPVLERRLHDLLPAVTNVGRCLSENVVPTLDMKIEDGPHTTGDPVWLDMLHAFTGATGASPAFDGNGVAIRLGVAEGENAVLGVLPGLGQVAMTDRDILGVRPTWLGYGVEQPWRPDANCADQPLPDLGKRSGPPPTWDVRR